MYCPKVLCHRLWGVAAMVCLTLLLNACGGGGGGASASPSELISNPNQIVGPTISGGNVMAVTIDSGPAGSYYLVNRLFASVTICLPGTSTCQTLDHVLVDTGSTGLRVMASALNSNMQNIAISNGVSGSTGPLLNCVNFLDGSFAWGPVANADVTLGSKTVSNLPIQVIADSHTASLSSNCSTSGADITSVNGSSSTDPSALGATGILGISYLKQDCGPDCVTSSNLGAYFQCTTGSCTAVSPSTAPLANQVTNPVALFSADNNGLIVNLPAITPAGAGRVGSMQGSVVFGINTQANNSSAGTTLLLLDTNNSDSITTTLNGTPMSGSFLDTGSNGLFFDPHLAGLSACSNASGASGFYCTNGYDIVGTSATLTGTNGAPKTVSFNVSTPTFDPAYNVYPMLAGPLGQSGTFDWGLPFFYGRSVFIGIEGVFTPYLGTGPFYAL